MPTGTTSSRWVRVPRPHPCPSVTLICLPHAGGGASTYHEWGPPLYAAGVEMRAIQYPGREDRIREPLLTTCPELVAALADAWPEINGSGRYALYGHSMGALLALELAHELIARGGPEPLRLFLSARNPPHLPRGRPTFTDVPDDRFIATLVAERLMEVPAPLQQDATLMRLVTQIMRADCAVNDSEIPTNRPPLDVPLSVFGGEGDHRVGRASLEQWRRYSRAQFRLRMVPGGHLFHRDAFRPLIAAIVADLASA